MNKALLLEQIITELQSTHQSALAAAMRAYNTATNDENIAENKYDTLALEASYLAHGQAQRVAECAADVEAFKRLQVTDNKEKLTVTLGSLVVLVDDHDNRKYIFLGPSAGGLKVTFAQKEIIVVTVSSPLGEALINRELDGQINVHIGDQVLNYEIAMIC